MLSMLLLLAVAPQAQAPAQVLRPATIQEMIDAGVLQVPAPATNDARARVFSDTGSGCETDVTRAADPSVSGGLMWRGGDQAVGLYRLLDRRVAGCPAPIIVNYRVPGSNAVGREVSRDREVSPILIRPR